MSADTAKAPRRTGRRVLLLVVLVAVLVATFGAWFAASRARTPAEQAAKALPPVPSVVTAAVTGGSLNKQLVLSAVVHRASTVVIHGPNAVVGASRLIVTRMPLTSGSEVHPGSLVAEVSGRPVIALRGPFGAYRDLTANDTGTDISELQSGLRDLFGTPVTGRFDWRTGHDLRQLYAQVGYAPLTVDAPVVSGAGQTHASALTTPPASSSAPAPAPAPPAPAQLLTVPAGEIAFIPNLPAVVSGQPATVGNAADAAAALVSVASGTWTVETDVNQEANAQLLSAGKSAKGTFTTGPLAGFTTRLQSLQPVAAATNASGADAPVAHAIFVVAAAKRGLIPGASQQITIQLLTTPAGALVVPASALWTGSDGRVVVEVLRRSTGHIDYVPVTVVLTSDGRAAVKPLAALHAGDPVVVAYPDGSHGP